MNKNNLEELSNYLEELEDIRSYIFNKRHYFNLQDAIVFNWVESILKESEQSKVEKSEDNKKELKKELKKNE